MYILKTHLELLLVLDEVYVLGARIAVMHRHRVDPVVLILVLGPGWRRYEQFRAGLLHALIDLVNAVDAAVAPEVLGKEEKRAEADDTEGQEDQEDEILLARAERAPGEQLSRLYTAHEALITRQQAGPRARHHPHARPLPGRRRC